jgi:hypothetical protein
MPYQALQWDQLPRLSLETVLKRHGIEVRTADDVAIESEAAPRTFIEASPAGPSSDTRPCAAYVDLKMSQFYPKIRIGVTCSIRRSSRTESALFSVRCHAFAHHGQLGGETFVAHYEEAQQLAMCFIDYAGDWISADEPEKREPAAEPVVPHQTELQDGNISASPAFVPPELRAAQEQLHQWSTHLTQRLASQCYEENEECSLEPSRGTDTRTTLTVQQTASVWKRLCREVKGLCRLRSGLTCSLSDSALIVREYTSGRELHVQVSTTLLRMNTPETTEIIQIFKAAKGGIVFEGARKISSVPQMASTLLQELTRAQH